MTPDEAIVVLGHELRSEEIHPELKGRMDTALDIIRAVDDTVLVLTGGLSNEAVELTESEVMRDYAVSQGISETLILEEREALDTIGNAYFTRRLLEDDDLDVPSVRIVTSCYHMPRSFYIFHHCFFEKYELLAGPCHHCADPPPVWQERAKLAWCMHFLEDVPMGDMEALRLHLLDNHERYNERAETGLGWT